LSDVPQHTPRRVSGDGTQTEVTVAQRVAELDVIAVAVGVVMVGATLAADTTTSTHALQLSPSFDSMIVPKNNASLSVHTRTE
jgi:hypothetical protein